MSDLLDVLGERAIDIITKSPALNPRQRLAETANAFEADNNNEVRVQFLNTALHRFTITLYGKDTTGRYKFIDPVTYRILIGKPWGGYSWKIWGLRQWESRVLRGILIERSQTRRPYPLFKYGVKERQWYLNVTSYPDVDAAMSYIGQDYMIRLEEWHRFADTIRSKARETKY